MVTNVVDLSRLRRPAKCKGSNKIATAECWNRIYEVIKEMPDGPLRREALEFWNQKATIILYSPHQN